MESDASNTGARKGINTAFDPGHLTETKHGGHTGCRVGRNCRCCAAVHACMHYHVFLFFMMTQRCSAVSARPARRSSAKFTSLASGAWSYTCIDVPRTCMRVCIHQYASNTCACRYICAYIVLYTVRSAVAILESLGAFPPSFQSV